MNHQLFSHVISDYYTRHYELAPSLTSGLQVTIYAECSPNNSGVNGHFYALELYFSANEFPVRDHIIGITFGANRMERNQIDAEIDSWVEQTITNDTFPELLESYIGKEGMWENILMVKKMWQNEQLNHFVGMIQRAPHMLALVIPT